MESLKFSLLQERCHLCLTTECLPFGICKACFEDLPRITTNCILCSKPMPTNAICGECHGKKQILHSCMLSAFKYEFPIDIMIHKAKFQQNIAWLKLLSQLMKEEMIDKLSDVQLPDYIVPVPLHVRRFKQRGFNQSLQLIIPLAKELGLKIRHDDVIRRVRHTEPQSQLDQKQRRKNIKDAFQIKTNIKGDRIALVDDIISTGSTVNEIARLLKQNGAAEIQIWCLARNIID